MVSGRDRRGFTLVELMVVLLVISLGVTLLAYTGYRLANSGRDVAANASVDRVIAAERDLAQRYGVYSPHPADLDVGRDLTVVIAGAASTEPTTVSIAVGSAGTLTVAARSTSGACYAREVTAAVQGGQEIPVVVPSTSACDAELALPTNEQPVTDKTIKG